MDSIDETGSTPERPAWRAGLRRLRLQFGDSYLESTFRADQFRHNLGNIRFAFLAGSACGSRGDCC